jgi:hypothetical protein
MCLEVTIMSLLAWILAIGALAPSGPPCRSEQRLTELAAAVRSADYRGDREALARLAEKLGEIDDPSFLQYRNYWQGFARWRRAQNGFNETPMPSDLGDDLEKAVTHFRASLERRPDWIEAKLALAGCFGNLAFVNRGDPEKMKALLAELAPVYQWLVENGRDNPRALWIIGGYQFAAPPPYGGDIAKAAATLRRGVELAWKESLSSPASAAWVPAWGGPENLMNLAYMYSHVGTPDRTAALAYAEGAVTAVPEWHYVRDILLPQIQKLPVAVAAR